MAHPEQSRSQTSVGIPAAAEFTNTSTKFIRARIASGDLPAYRIKGSRIIRIRVADLESLMQPIGGDAV